MNFLALCNSVKEKGSVSGADLTAVTNQIGVDRRIVNWVNDSWLYIQSARNDWNWMRGAASFTTIPNVATYTPASINILSLSSWHVDRPLIYLPSEGKSTESYLASIDYYTDFYDMFVKGSHTADRPRYIGISNDNTLNLGPTPDVAYLITIQYQLAPSKLVLATDIPSLPEQYHLGIVYRALMMLAADEGDSDLYDEARSSYEDVYNRMSSITKPEIKIHPQPLA